MDEFDIRDWHQGPLRLIWPTKNSPTDFLEFNTYAEWRRFVDGFSLRSAARLIVTNKYRRAQRMYLLAWLDFDIVKAAELAALVALELALQNQYGGEARKLRPPIKVAKPEGPGSLGLRFLLTYMIQHDGLTADALPPLRRPGKDLLERIVGTGKPNLVDIGWKISALAALV